MLPPPAAPAVLLVLLPVASGDTEELRAVTNAALGALQTHLGAAIRVLKIDEVSHPVVVRSFDATELPVSVLMQRGVELWRRQGLPEGEGVATELISKLRTSNPATQQMSVA